MTHASAPACPLPWRRVAVGLALALHASLALSADGFPPASAAAQQHPVARLEPGGRPQKADLGAQSASVDVRHLADWVLASGDNHQLPFVIVDKKEARVFVFRADGKLSGAASALLGLAVGDDSVPGIGDRKLADIRPFERTTPAGRFDAALGQNLHGVDILWLDYEGALSLHRVITTNPRDRRAQRLASPSVAEKRISYGCINVPVQFYEQVVKPAFTGTNGVVYVLPETRSLQVVFGAGIP